MNKKGFANVAIIIGVVVLVGIAGYFLLNQRLTPSVPTPTPTTETPTSTTSTQTPTANSNSNAITVSLGQEFTLKKGETAGLKDLNVFLKVKDFIYSPCPKGYNCVWSGLAVVFELTVDGKVYSAHIGHLPPEAPYDVLVKKTDYKTFATLVINRPEIRCVSRNGISQDKCLHRLAKRLSDQSYCGKIGDTLTKDACFEDLAKQLKKQ